MWLQRYIKRQVAGAALRSAGLALAALLITGCASGPRPAKAPDSGQSDASGRAQTVREVSPEARTLYEQAVSVMASGDFLDAQLRFQEFLLRYPDFPGAHVNLAIIFAANGDDRAAEGSITDALIIDPEYPPALNQLGMLLRRQGSFPQAEAAYLKAVTVRPDYALAHYNLGVLYELYFRRLGDALQHFQRYQELSGDDKQVSKWIADLERRISSNRRTANVTE